MKNSGKPETCPCSGLPFPHQSWLFLQVEQVCITHADFLTFPSADPSRSWSAALTQRGRIRKSWNPKFPRCRHFDEPREQVMAGVGGAPRALTEAAGVHFVRCSHTCPAARGRLGCCWQPVSRRLSALGSRCVGLCCCPCGLLSRWVSFCSKFPDALFWLVSWRPPSYI